MNPSIVSPSNPVSVDPDLAEQARSGHGIPSQDPSAAAQRPLEPGEAEREAQSVLAGGGMVAGAVVGVAIGTVVAGPVGAVVGGTIGAVAGALGGAASGPLVSPDAASAAAQTAAEKSTPAR